MQSLLIAVVFAIVALQLVFSILLTRRLLACNYYEADQKRLQLLLVWLLPVVGVIVVWLFLNHERPQSGVKQHDEDDDVEESIFSHHEATPGTSTSLGDAGDH